MTTDNDETSLYTDLKGFLASDRLDLRRAATEAVLQVADDRGMSKIVSHGLVELLARNCSSTDSVVSVNALKALLHLASAEGSPEAKATSLQCLQELLDQGRGLDRLMEILLTTPPASPNKEATLSAWRKRVNLAMSLLVNMTRSEEGAVALCGRQLPDEAVVAHHQATKATDTNDSDKAPSVMIPPKPTLDLLLARFLNSQYIQPDIDYHELLVQATDNSDPTLLDSHTGDPFQHFASVLMNATQTEQGRRFLLQLHYAPDSRKADAPPPLSHLQRLLPLLRHPNPLRRRGVAGVLRNCCSDKDSAFWLLTQVNVVDEHILYLLAGPEELDEADKQNLNPDLWLEGPSKQREPDRYTRLFLTQALLMLCRAGRMARRELNRIKTSVILKWASMVEEYEDVSDAMEQCLQYLKRDELSQGEGQAEDDFANRIELLDDDEDDVGALIASAAQPVKGAAQITQEDYDNVD